MYHSRGGVLWHQESSALKKLAGDCCYSRFCCDQNVCAKTEPAASAFWEVHYPIRDTTTGAHLFECHYTVGSLNRARH